MDSHPVLSRVQVARHLHGWKIKAHVALEIEVTAFARRSVFLAVIVWSGYFGITLDVIPFTAETDWKYKLTTSDKLGLQN
jgi:hypothetical protein